MTSGPAREPKFDETEPRKLHWILRYLPNVVSEVAHRAGAVLAHGAVVPVLQLLVVGNEALGGDAFLGLPRRPLLHTVRHEHVRLQVGLLLAAEVALLALVQVDRLGGRAVLPQQVIAARFGLLRLRRKHNNQVKECIRRPWVGLHIFLRKLICLYN